MNSRIGIARRRRGVEPVDVGEQHQAVGADHGGDAGGEPVVVAVADLGGRDGVVLVDDRHGPQLEQRRDGGAGVEIAAALLGVAERQQDLAGDRGRAGRALPTRRRRARSGRRRRPPGSPRASARRLPQAEHAAAERDRAGGDDEHLAPLARERRRCRRPARSSQSRFRPVAPSTSSAEPILTTMRR